MGTQDKRDARFLQSVLAASEDCIKVLSIDGKLDFMSEGGQRVMEVSDFNAIQGCPWPDFWEGEGNIAAQEALEAARNGKSARFQGAANTAAGNPRYWDVQVSPIFGPDGKPESILSVSRDITELKAAEERTRLVLQELKHRIKNAFGLVQGITNASFRTGGTPEQIKQNLLGRLETLSQAQDLLTQSAWERASIRQIVDSALKLYGSVGRIRIDGPELVLSSKSALGLALALYELTTNAIKYGSLSNDTGHVDLTWSVDHEAKPVSFLLRWQESGGPHVEQPKAFGFGSRMIERALAGYFGGTTRIDYEPTGVVFTLVATLDALTSY